MEYLNKNLKRLINTLETVENAEKTIGDLDRLSNEIFKVGGTKFDKLLQDNLSYKTYQVMKEIFQDDYFSDKNLQKMRMFFLDLKERLKKTPVLKLVIAFEPTETFVTGLYSWILENVGTDILLDFEIDQGVFAGADVVYKGIYGDYSYKKKLEVYFAGAQKIREETKKDLEGSG